jgi:ribonuclease T1
MQKNYTQLLLGILIGMVIGFVCAKLLIGKPKEIANNNNPVNYPTKNRDQKENNNHINNNVDFTGEGNYNGNESIPAKVREVLQYVKANGQAMNGYVGGREFTNRQNVLPVNNASGQRIKYQEWDVNPKVQGKNRGVERMCTGDDGRSWYTSDHYKSFTEIK